MPVVSTSDSRTAEVVEEKPRPIVQLAVTNHMSSFSGIGLSPDTSVVTNPGLAIPRTWSLDCSIVDGERHLEYRS